MPRGRPRKQPLAENEILSESAAPIAAAAPDQGPQPGPVAVGVKKVRNKLNQEWIEDVPIFAQPQTPDFRGVYPVDGGGEVGVIEPEEYEEPEEEIDQEDAILSGFDLSGDNLTVTVWELPRYSKDRDISPRAERILRGSIELPSEVKTPEAFLSLIQQTFARPREGNYWFQPVLRRGGKICKKLPAVCISPLEAATVITPAGTGSAILPAALPAPAPVDPLAQLKQAMQVVKEFNQMMAPAVEKRAQETAPATINAGQPITDELAFMHLAKTDDEVMKALRKRFLGPILDGEASTAGGDSWSGIIKDLMPFLGPVLMQFLQSRQQPAAQPQPTAPLAPATPPVPPTIDDQFFQTLYVMAIQNRPLTEVMPFIDQMLQAETRIEIHMDAICEYKNAWEIARFVRRNCPQPELLPAMTPAGEAWFEQLAEAWRLDRDEELSDEPEQAPENEATIIELPSRAGDPA